jgi:hypothetical protein
MKPNLMCSMRARMVLWGALAVLAVQPARGAYDGAGTFTKITSRAELTDGYYVIASSNGLAAMSHTNAGSFFTSNAISPSADVLTDPSPAVVWLVQTNATYGGHTLFNEASNRYVAYAGTANAAHPAGAVNGTTGTWTFAYGAGAFDVANVAISSRILQYNAGAPRFACYTTVQQKLALYKMETVAQIPPAFGANPGPVSTTTGVEVVFTVTATGSPEPVLALQGTTASGGYSFTAGTGELVYIPPPADADTTRTFTFTASNSAGVATQSVSVTVVDAVVAPIFTGGTSFGATTLVAMAFTVTASGNPAPALALQSQTASSGFGFTPATGVLDYTPPTNDVGERTFTFTASNSAGVATQVVGVAVSSAPVAIPAVSIANIGTNSFTVNWTACDGATTYQIQIATDTNFTAGGGANVMTNPGFETGDSTGWDKFETEYSVASTDPQEGTYHVAISATATRDLTQNVAITGDGSTAYEISYWYKGSGNARIWSSWTTGGQVSGDSLQPVDYNPAAAEWTKMTYAVVPQSGANTLFYEIRTYTGASMQFDSFFAGEAGGGTGGSLVVDETLAALTYAAAGLDMETTYYIRVRQTGGEWSSVVTATTAGAEPAAPVFTGGAGPYGITAGDLLDFTVSAIGTPTPVLALSVASAHVDDYAFEPATGYFLYQPPLGDGGTAQTFTFTASNTEGVATQVVTVNVAAATAPVFGSNPGPLTATTGVARSFTVGAMGVPDPVLALQSSTASGGSYAFAAATGVLEYTPPTNDLGARSFTFTASNVAGVATQQVHVSVSNAPALPAIDPLPALTIETGQTSNLWVVAREADGDWITLFASNLPANATFTTVGGTGAVSNQFSFSPASNQAGQAYAVVFYAGDADGTNSRTLNITVANNDPWAEYYASCYSNGVLKTGNDLKNALHNIIDGHTSFSYTAVENILKVIDECPTNSTMVQLLYLQHGRDKNNFGGLVGQWNREHVWANSHGINDSLPAYTDVHHLHPTDVTVNNTRGNLDFDPRRRTVPARSIWRSRSTRRGDDVVIVWNSDGTFTTPSGTPPAVGAAFAGGTVLYKGGVSPLSHTGLTACATYYYKCWSYAGTVYSTNGLTASATTLAPAAPASVWASARRPTTFTANWSAVAGAAGYRLDVCTVPGFSGAGAGWSPVFRETMGTPTAGTTTLGRARGQRRLRQRRLRHVRRRRGQPGGRPHQRSFGQLRRSGGERGVRGANVYFTTTGVSGAVGFGIAGIDTRGYERWRSASATTRNPRPKHELRRWIGPRTAARTWNPDRGIQPLPAANAAGNMHWYIGFQPHA